MSPARQNPNRDQVSAENVSTHGSEVKIRKRVRKACDRCRIKKTKCDGSSPCLRCKTDNVLCCAKTSHRIRRRNFPPGYTEMLERQHSQLVSCVQELYQRARRAGSWDEPLPDDGNRYPSVHDILAALNLLEPKDDGSKEFETFNEVVRPVQPESDSPAAINDGLANDQDHLTSTPDQSRSPSLPHEDTTPFPPGTPVIGPLSSLSSRPPSSSQQTTEFSPGHPKQTIEDHTTTTTTPRMAWQQTLAEYNSSQARLFATLATKPLNGTFYNNTPNVSLHQYGAPTPSLSLDSQTMSQDYTSYQRRAISASSDTLPFYHDWAKNGIMVDDSDFSTDFRRLSQLDVGVAHVGQAGLDPGMM